MRELTICSNAALPEAALDQLREGVRPHRLILLPPKAANTGAGDAGLDEADVAFGQPDLVASIASPRLAWIHLNSAGYAAYQGEELRSALLARGATLTKSSQVYEDPCAEHLLAFLFAQARELPQALSNQRGERAWPQLALRARSRLLRGQSAVLVGFGAIARRLVELLAPLHMDIVGLRQRVAGDEPVRTLAWDTPEATAALGLADHVIDILPASPSTHQFFDAARLAKLKAGAVLYNIGRGTTVDQAALIASLRAGHLAAAYLDVTDPEPLPPEHPLWTTPNCFITPHAAGGHHDEPQRLVQHFLENLRRFTTGHELLDRVF